MNTSSYIENFTLYHYDADTGVCVLDESIEQMKNYAAYKRIASKHDPDKFPDK